MQLEEFDIEFLALKMSENPQSMLFARLADLYLGKEQTAEAMKLLEEGIPNFPEYYAGYIILGKTHLAFKEYSRAHAAFAKALELSPFNLTAAQLLATVPNRPDESTRTTDESYFAAADAAPSALVQPDQVYDLTANSGPDSYAPEPGAALEQSQHPGFELPAAEEMNFTQTAHESAAPAVDPFASAYGTDVSSSSTEAFPTYDEYFAANQHRIDVQEPFRLDDYLNGDVSVATNSSAPVIDELPSHEFVNDAYVEPTPSAPAYTSPAVEEHMEPEPVFSSPEQAQLFAEMTGTAEPEPVYSDTDLDSLTQMLQGAEKIVPEENYQPKTPTPKETPDEQAYETDAVTPTLAEIYASQGEYRAAIQAYEILMFSQPARGGDYQKRIRELQQLQMEKDGLI